MMEKVITDYEIRQDTCAVDGVEFDVYEQYEGDSECLESGFRSREEAERFVVERIRELWKEFSEVPVDNDDRIESDFNGFEAGTDRFEVMEWFDSITPNGMVRELYGTD